MKSGVDETTKWEGYADKPIVDEKVLHDQLVKTNVGGYTKFTKLMVPNINPGGRVVCVTS